MKKSFKTIIALVLAVVLFSSMLLFRPNGDTDEQNNPVTIDTPTSGYVGDDPYETVVISYYEAMAVYDMAMNSPENGFFTPENVFLDPHEAWEDYIANERCNNWFLFWYNEDDKDDRECADIRHESHWGMPNSLIQTGSQVDRWWKFMDSYIANVQAGKDHIVNKRIIWEDGVGDLAATGWAQGCITDEDRLWMKWVEVAHYDIANPAFTPIRTLTFQKWKDFWRNTYKDEFTLFYPWLRELRNKPVGPTWEEYKAERAPDNKPSTLSVTEDETPAAKPSDTVTTMAYANSQTITVDGKPVEFPCYALKDENGNMTNYVRLRDLALVMNDTKKPFTVLWEENKVFIFTPVPYLQANGSEMNTPFSGDRMCQATPERSSYVNIEGSDKVLHTLTLTDDNGGGYTYYPLRELGEILDVNVGWSADKGIFVETDKPYSPNN